MSSILRSIYEFLICSWQLHISDNVDYALLKEEHKKWLQPSANFHVFSHKKKKPPVEATAARQDK